MEKKIWVLIDNRAGSNGQARGVAEVLGWPFVEKKLEYNRLSKLPNLLKGASLIGIANTCKQNISSDFPDLVISASRRTAPVARWIKKRSQGKTKIIQIMHPGCAGIKDFDKIFVSEHDRHKKCAGKVTYIIGSPHRITAAATKEAQEKWSCKFAHLPRPLTGVIVGGTVGSHPFTIENAQELGRQIRAYKDKVGGSVLITTSRRTGMDPQNALMEQIQDIPSYTYLWGIDEGDNPYMGFMSCADDFIVTGDSVSMTSEACGSGKRVMIFIGKDWLPSKHQRFVNSFFEKGLAFPLEQSPKQGETYKSYNAAELIVSEIKNLF